MFCFVCLFRYALCDAYSSILDGSWLYYYKTKLKAIFPPSPGYSVILIHVKFFAVNGALFTIISFNSWAIMTLKIICQTR